MQEVSSCLICESGAAERLYESTFDGTWQDAVPLFLTERETVAHGSIVKCAECGFVYTNPQFSAQEYASIYAAVRERMEPSGHDRGEQFRIDKRRRLVTSHNPGSRFLDLGCGSGAFHRSLTDYDGAGFEVRPGTDVDYDETGRIYRGEFPTFAADADRAARYDFVTAWDVLEHLAEPDADLAAVHRILKPGGLFFCTVPNMASLVARLSGRRWNCVLLEHLWYFTPQTLTRYLKKFGFEVLKTGGHGYPVDFQTIALRLAQTYGGSSPRLPKFIADRVIDLPIGLMYAVCRRT